MEPQEIERTVETRRSGSVRHRSAHKHGRHLDWYLGSDRTPLRTSQAVAIAGADHVRKGTELASMMQDAPGIRLELPTR